MQLVEKMIIDNPFYRVKTVKRVKNFRNGNMTESGKGTADAPVAKAKFSGLIVHFVKHFEVDDWKCFLTVV